MTPSRMFDVLKEDFDYWFIVGTFGACNHCFPETGVNQSAAASMAVLLQTSCKGSQITVSLDYKHLDI